MLKSGLGESAQILRLLEDTAADPDPRMVELSALIIREQLNSRETKQQPDEIAEDPNDTGGERSGPPDLR